MTYRNLQAHISEISGGNGELKTFGTVKGWARYIKKKGAMILLPPSRIARFFKVNGKVYFGIR